MIPIPKFLKTHQPANNTVLYTPTFTDGSGHKDSNGSIGTWSPNWFGIHNPDPANGRSVKVWTVDQGTSGTGSTIYLAPGATEYVNIAKLETPAGSFITVLGTTNTAGIL
jgi:hypothetical protein